MGRLTGWVLAVGLTVLLGQPARAQMPGPAFGGFGPEYMQRIPSDSLLLDRWWMLEATPSVGGMLPPTPVVEQPALARPAARLAVPGRAPRTNRSLGRVRSRSTARYAVQPVPPLPTGSLYWPGAAGVPLYSPAQRYATYGWGYGVSPYGTADYGGAYKGYYWGH